MTRALVALPAAHNQIAGRRGLSAFGGMAFRTTAAHLTLCG
jgi:hypothetical protein